MKTRMVQRVMSGLIVLIGMGCAACGGGSSNGAPTIVSVTDGWGVALPATGTATNVNPTSFTVTFSEPMNVAAVTTAGAFTVTCAGLPTGLAQPTVTVAEPLGGDGTIFTVTVTDADGNPPWKYQLLTCTATATANIVSAAGVAIAPASYTLVTACAVSDDFNADSQACWTWRTGVFLDMDPAPIMATWNSWAEAIAAGAFLFSPTTSTLNVASVIDPSQTAAFQKSATVDPNGFEIIIHATGVQNIDANTGQSDQIGVGLMRYTSSVQAFVSVGFQAFDPTPGNYVQACSISCVTMNGKTPLMSGDSTPCPNSEYYLRLASTAASNASFIAQYREPGETTWHNIATATYDCSGGGTYPTTWANMTDMVLIDLFQGKNGETVNFDTIQAVSGITSTTQY